jgi:hypothetical protein
MGDRLHRTQILLEPEQHRALTELAKREGRTISEVVREMLGRELEARKQAEDAVLRQRFEGLERVRKLRAEIVEENGGQPIDFDVIEAVTRMRDERDERNLTGTDSTWVVSADSGG